MWSSNQLKPAAPAVRIADGAQASAGDLVTCTRNDHAVEAGEPGPSPKRADPVPGPRPAPGLARYDQIHNERDGVPAPLPRPASPGTALGVLAAEHAQVFQDAMRAHHAGESERAGRLREDLQAIWSQAWSANYAALEFMQGTGLTRFAPVKPRRWVVADHSGALVMRLLLATAAGAVALLVGCSAGSGHPAASPVPLPPDPHTAVRLYRMSPGQYMAAVGCVR